MDNSFRAWSECAADLVAVAAGRRPADLVILGGQLANVHSREILRWDVAISAGRFAYVGPDASYCIGPETKVLRWSGYVIPGLCDGHMHVESSMLTPAEFARAVIPHGTTTMFTDPHEIANVMGIEGVKYMIDKTLDDLGLSLVGYNRSKKSVILRTKDE